jgi:hypothetical protein
LSSADFLAASSFFLAASTFLASAALASSAFFDSAAAVFSAAAASRASFSAFAFAMRCSVDSLTTSVLTAGRDFISASFSRRAFLFASAAAVFSAAAAAAFSSAAFLVAARCCFGVRPGSSSILYPLNAVNAMRTRKMS